MRNFWRLTLLILVISCKSSSEKRDYIFNLESDLHNGELTLSVDDTPQELKEKGEIVDFHTTNDKKTIAVEIAKFSTLSILKIYKWDATSKKYVSDTTNINSTVWNRFSKKHSINPKELASSHVYFLDWRGLDSIALVLRGRTEVGRFISDTLVLKY